MARLKQKNVGIISRVTESFKIILAQIFSTIFKVVSPPVFWLLREVEQVCNKVAEQHGRPLSTLKFSLSFPNGQSQEVTVDTDGSFNRGGDNKRVKLILDINQSCVPDEKYEVIAVKNFRTRNESKLRIPLDWVLQMLAYYLLEAVKYIELFIEKIEHYLHRDLKPEKNGQPKCDGEKRKKLSPRKKYNSSKVSVFQRFAAFIKKLLTLPKEQGILFDPIEGVANLNLNRSYDASRYKFAEKRKLPASSASEGEASETADSSDDSVDSSDEHTTRPVRNKASAGSEKESRVDSDIDDQSGEVTSSEFASKSKRESKDIDGNNETSATSASTSFDTEHQGGSPRKNYFDVDEDYKSSEDADYVPSPHGSSSSEQTSSIDEEAEQIRTEEAREEEKLLAETGEGLD